MPGGAELFLQQLDDKRFKLLGFDPSDPGALLFRPKPEVGPSAGPIERKRKKEFASQFQRCVNDANRTYNKQIHDLHEWAIPQAYSLTWLADVTTAGTALGAGLKASKGLVGKVASKAVGKAMWGSTPFTLAFNWGVAMAYSIPQEIIYSQASDAAIESCYSLWHKF